MIFIFKKVYRSHLGQDKLCLKIKATLEYVVQSVNVYKFIFSIENPLDLETKEILNPEVMEAEYSTGVENRPGHLPG